MDSIVDLCIFTLISIAFNLLLAIPLISLLYKKGFYKTTKTEGVDISKRNPLWYNHLGNTLGRPSSFGVLILADLALFYCFQLVGLSGSLDKNINLIILFFTGFLGLGFVDDYYKYFYYLKTKKWGLGAFQKLFVHLILAFVFLVLYSQNFDLFYLLLYGLLLSFLVNAFNITDGLDGYVGSLSLIIFPILIYFEFRTFQDFDIIRLFLLIWSFFVVFTYFNIKPGRVTLGDSGSLPIGFILGFAFLRYSNYALAFLFLIIIIEGLSSFIQILSIKLFKKKVFLIAPYHLHLLNKGWTDTKVVQRSFLLQIILAIIAILFFEYFLIGI